jgi:hypothetical protein
LPLSEGDFNKIIHSPSLEEFKEEEIIDIQTNHKISPIKMNLPIPKIKCTFCNTTVEETCNVFIP